jgi:imidazolonepropionase-like amidohydrolase
MTGDQTVTDGAVVIGDRTVDWVGPVSALPAGYLSLPRADYPGSTIMPGLIDSHVHLAFDGGPNPAARMRAETGEQQLMLYASPDHAADLRLVTEATRRRNPAQLGRRPP